MSKGSERRPSILSVRGGDGSKTFNLREELYGYGFPDHMVTLEKGETLEIVIKSDTPDSEK